ncbi:MAG: glycosyltransferase [Candidatus Bipolaricaulis sp.]|nr:glycosyltransferase [Candidatus Bipolaricaulis sp.]
MNNRFAILITQRDAAPFIRKCLDSVVSQTYKNYEVIIMDDNSTDGTWEIIKNEYSRFQCIHTPKQDHPVTNFVAGINLIATDREDIIVFLSGDDYLYGNDVLEYLNGVYQDKDVWMTYGNYIRTSGKHGKGCSAIPDTRTYRKSGAWFASHLVTCKKKLWDRIDDADFRYIDGNYPNHSFDGALLYPAIEISGHKHLRFIDKILYVYNDQNPIAAIEYKKDKKAFLRERQFFMSKNEYPELTEL